MAASNTSSGNSNTTQVKYRPYFTASQIDELVFCLKQSSSNVGLIRYLETFRAKISFDAVSKVVATPRASIEDKLGFSSPNPPAATPIVKEHYYQQWLESPDSLSMRELELAHTYRYENDLMTPDEEADFEKQIGI